jgi:hypothetical protein
MYGQSQTIEQLSISKLVGSFRNRAFIFGNAAPGIIDAVASVSISDSIVTSAADNSMTEMVTIFGSVGICTFQNVTWEAPGSMASTWFNCICTPETGCTTPPHISDLRIVGCRTYLSTSGSGTPSLIALANGIAYSRVTIDGFGVGTEAGESLGPVPFLIDTQSGSGSIQELVINSLDPTNIMALVNPSSGFAGITTISGPGVLATGFPIPDSLMANDSWYISATSPNAGIPCIKVGGIVYPLAVSMREVPYAAHTLITDNSGAGSGLTHDSNSSLSAGSASFSVFGFWYADDPIPSGRLLMIMGKGGPTQIEYILYYANASSQFSWTVYDTAGSPQGALDTTTVPTAGTWFFVVGVFDATSSTRVCRIYTNGVLQATANAGTLNALNDSAPFRISRIDNDLCMNGRVAMCGKISAVLSASDVSWLYNGGSGRSADEINAEFTSPGVDCLYMFDQITNLGNDSSVNGNTLTSVGATAPTQAAGPS